LTSSESRVGPGTWVSLAYSLYDAEGEELDHSPEDAPLQALVGYGQLLPALEQAIEGLSAGQARSLRLLPEQAFGERDPRRVIEIDRGEFPDDVEAGDHYEMENQAGKLLVFRVLEVSGDSVRLDTNHPLAGQRVRVELRVCAVRPATADELSLAEQRLQDPAEPGDSPLLSVERLLRGGTRR
jgi:FKBP-type peptidyl-prolyl cis-trans isomerase SlyD